MNQLEQQEQDAPAGTVRVAREASQAAAGFIFVTVTLDVMAGTMAIPVLPTLITTVSPGDAARTSELYGLLTTIFFAMQFVAGPIQGLLSDRFGRRPIILAGLFGFAVDFLIMAVARNLFWLFFARAVSGLLAGNITAANAYLVDTTPSEKRARMFGFFSAAAGFGSTVGPALGGMLATYGVRAPFWAAAALSLLNALYGAVVLPESLPKNLRAPFVWKKANPIGAPRALLLAYPSLAIWGLVLFLFSLGGLAVNSVWVIYTGYRYQWAPRDIGIFLSAISILGIAVQTGLVGPFVKWLGERWTMLIGMGLNGLGCVIGGLSATGTWFWIATFVLVVGNICGPTQAAIMSRMVGPSEQGLLAGAATSVRSVNGIAAPLIFTALFAFCVRVGGVSVSGVPNVVAGALMVGAGIIAWAATRASKGLS